MLNFFKKGKSNSAEKFWSWFKDNQVRIEKFVDSDHSEYSVYNTLTKEIKKYNDYLFPELTKTEDDQYVLIITPDGMKDGVKPTQDLFNACPEVKGWVIKKFRQPCDKITLNIDGLEYPSPDIEIHPEIDHDKEQVDIQVFIRNMSSDVKKHQQLAFLYLDHILGEFNTITKVGYIDFHNLEKDKSVKDSINLLDLRKLIEKELY